MHIGGYETVLTKEQAMKAPCKDCQDRCEKCHKTCSEYYLFKQEKKRVAKQKEKDRMATPQPSKKMLQFMKNKSMGR